METLDFAGVVAMKNRTVFFMVSLCVFLMCSNNDKSIIPAATMGTVEDITKELNKGANVNVRDEFGRTALMYALEKCKSENAVLLIQNGADVNTKDKDGYTPFLNYVYGDCHDSTIINILLKHNCDIFATTNSGENALMGSAAKNDTLLLTWLINKRFDIQQVNNAKQNALHYAVKFNSLSSARILIRSGVNKDVKDEMGLTALEYARKDSSIAMISILKSE